MFPKSFRRPVIIGRKPFGALERRSQAGFTLIELLVVLVVAVILGTVLVRFYKDSYRSYSMQEQYADRDQTAHFVVTKLVEVLQQAGSALPDTGWTALTIPAGTLMRIGINPRGAEQFVGTAAGSSNFIAVDSADLFTNTSNTLLNTTHILLDYADVTKATVKRTIDVSYNSGGFLEGVKDNVSPTKDSIRVTATVVLAVGDKVYGYREDEYDVSGTDLVLKPNGSVSTQMVLAENIDSIGIVFRKIDKSATTTWSVMRSASVTVRARTEMKDLGLSPPDYRKITLSMNVIMRNRI